MRPEDTKPNIIAWYRQEMGFSNAVATMLYEAQSLDGWTPLSQLEDKQVDQICQAIQRDLKESIAELAVTRLKLATFWIKHLLRTNRRVGHPGQVIVKAKQETFLALREQKKMEDDWRSNNKEPEYTPMTLDVASAPKVFEKIQTILTRIRGVKGVPLSGTDSSPLTKMKMTPSVKKTPSMRLSTPR